VDGGAVKNVGTGHLARCLLMARAVRDRHRVVFASLDVPEFAHGHDRITRDGYPLHRLPAGDHAGLAKLANCERPDFTVCDLYEYDEAALRALKTTGAPLMTFDHLDASRAYADYAIDAVSPRTDGPFSGPDYIVVPPPTPRAFRDPAETIFVSFGGFDYFDLTPRVMGVIAKLDVRPRVDVVVGGVYDDVEGLKRLARQNERITVHRQPEDFAALLNDADIAFVSGGLTMFQALSCGVATAVISQYDHQAATVADFRGAGAYLDLGKGDVVDAAAIAAALTHLIEASDLRRTLGENGRKLVDGRGLERIVRIVEDALA
jgi:spore coat polysaccharide biosynthesis predicted glycosyltransferase SpsG